MVPSIPAVDLGTGSLKIKSIYSGDYSNFIEYVDGSLKAFGVGLAGKLGVGVYSGVFGISTNDMGQKLPYVQLFSPTKSPTLPPSSPTKSPIPPTPPTNSPTQSPISPTFPTSSPTQSPTQLPTPPAPPSDSPTRKPTKLPTRSPTSAPVVPQPLQSICTGGSFACALFDNKQVKCWGMKIAWGASSLSVDNLGDATSEIDDSIPFVDFGTNVAIKKVSCGNNHICAQTEEGDVKCLGNHDYSQLGLGIPGSIFGTINGFIGDNLPFVNLGNGLKVLDISLGSAYSCVVVTGNKAKCYGVNMSGELGYGDTKWRGSSTFDMGDNLAFVDLGTNVEIDSIHSGPLSAHKCAILSAPSNATQRIKCWGYNIHYQLGYGDADTRGDNIDDMGDNLPLVDLGKESKVKQIALGASHTCVLLINNSLKCFGYGGYGQLGSASTNPGSITGIMLKSVAIDSARTVALVSAGGYHTCIAYEDLVSVKCVGANDHGQLGQGDKVQRGDTSSTIIPFIPFIDLGLGSLQISSIHSGIYFNCIVLGNKSVKCFGDNANAQLAIGSSSNIGDQSGEMGNNLQFARIFTPTQSPSKSPTPPTPPTQSPTSAPTKSPTPPTPSPTRVPTQSPTKRPTAAPVVPEPLLNLCTGGVFACAVFNLKQAKCWGIKIAWGSSSSPSDNLGDEPSEVDGSIPFIDFGTNVKIAKISCGNTHVCVKTVSGKMKCLGGNGFGKLGLGVTDPLIGSVNGFIGDDLPFVNVGNELQVLDISLGVEVSCVLLTGNKVKCYGKNDLGQLGQGDTINRGENKNHTGDNLPFIDFGRGVEIASVHTGLSADHSCVILSAPANAMQRVKCWSRNFDFSLLGYGDHNNRGDQRYEMGDNLTFVDFGDESRVKQIALGLYHTCALLIDGNLKCLGVSLVGQLGLGFTGRIFSTGNDLPFVPIDSGKKIQLLTAGREHTCIVYDDMISMKCHR